MPSAPLLLPTIAFVSAIAIGRYFPWPIELAVASAIIMVILALTRRHASAIVAASFTIGLAALIASAPPRVVPGRYNIRGVVESVKESESARHFIVATLHGRVYVTTPAFNPPIAPGDSLAFTGEVEPPASRHDLPDQGSIDNFYYTHRIAATAYVIPENLRREGESNSLYWRLRRVNAQLVDCVLRSNLDQGTGRLLAATIFGDRSHLDSDTSETFSSTGIAHMLAVSGMHAAMIGLIVSLILWPLGAAGHRSTMLAITITVLWIYAIATGLSPSVVRSVIMATLVAGSYMLQRSHSSFNALCCACLIILVFTPRALFEAGFQLSFAAVAGIIVWAGFFNRLGLRRWWARGAINAIGVPLAAMSATGLLSAYYFHRFPVLFLLANIPVGLIFPWFMGLGILWLVYSAIGFPTLWLDAALNFIYNLIEGLSEWIASLPCSTIEQLYFSAWALPLWFVGLTFAALWVWRRRHIYGWLMAIALIGAIAIIIIPPREVTPEYFITTNRQHVEIIVNDGKSATLITDGDSATVDDCSRRYADYLGFRRLGALQYHQLNADTLTLGADSFLVASGDDDSIAIDYTPTHILFTKGFKGSVTRVAQLYPDAAIILSSSINGRRLKRYVAELQAIGRAPFTTSTAPYHRYLPAK